LHSPRKVADWSSQQRIAFGAKNSLYVFDWQSKRFVGVLSGHSDRICAVEFNPTHPAVVYTGGADRRVIAWDVFRGVSLGSHTTSKSEVTCLAASLLMPDWVLSGDRNGRLVSWRYDTQETRQCTPVNDAVNCVAFSPLVPSQAVAGYRSGALLVRV
jgi:WD40 repeat protein